MHRAAAIVFAITLGACAHAPVRMTSAGGGATSVGRRPSRPSTLPSYVLRVTREGMGRAIFDPDPSASAP